MEAHPLCTPEEGCLLRKYGLLQVKDPFLSKTFWWVMGSTVGAILLILGLLGFLLYYPFRTVTFVEPIRVVNPIPPGKKQAHVPSNGSVDMEVEYEKFTDEPGLIIRTLVRRCKDGSMIVLDSNTTVSNRKAGKGVVDAHFNLHGATNLPGENTSIIFSIFYTLYGFRPVMVQFETEQFVIYDHRGVKQ